MLSEENKEMEELAFKDEPSVSVAMRAHEDNVRSTVRLVAHYLFCDGGFPPWV